MSLVHLTPLLFDKKKDHRSERAHPLRLLLSLFLALLLGIAPIPFNVSAQQNNSIDAEALLAVKADPLLQSVRRAARMDRAARDGKRVPESLKAPAEPPISEVESLSKLAGVNRSEERRVGKECR